MLPEVLVRWFHALAGPAWSALFDLLDWSVLRTLFGRSPELTRPELPPLLWSLSLPVGVSARRTLIRAYTRLYGMGKTIRVSDEFYSWLESQKDEDETMEDAIRRLVGSPHPEQVAGLFTPEEAEEMKETVKELRQRDRSRLDCAREAFSEDE